MTEYLACLPSPGLSFRHYALVLLLLLASFAGAADLFDVAQHGDVALLHRLLARPTTDVNAANDEGNTPLHLAVREHQVEVVSLLLDAGASLKARDAGGLTPLHLAAKCGYTDLLQTLIERKADMNARDDQGWTPLQWAVSMSQLDAAQVLLNRGVAVNAADTAGITPLHWAAANGQLPALELLLAKGASINTTDQEGYAPLHWAAAAGQQAAVKLLLAHGANPLLQDNQGRTPLMVADERGQTAIVSMLNPTASKLPNLPGVNPDALKLVIPDNPLAAPPAATLPSHRLTNKAQAGPRDNPLSMKATALYAEGGKLYTGLESGGIMIYDTSTGRGVAVEAPISARSVRAIAVGGGAVWWLTARPASLCAYREATQSASAFAIDTLRPASPWDEDADGAPTLTWWRNRVVICSPDGARALDPRTGQAQSLAALLPDALQTAVKGARLFLSADEHLALLAAVRQNGDGWSATTWRSNGSAWASAGERYVAQWRGVSAVCPQRLALIGSSGVADLLPVADKPVIFAYPTPARHEPAAHWAAASGSAIWWGGGDVMYHAMPDSHQVCAYLPWNDPGVSVRCAAADDAGVWLGTNRGVRRLNPGNPTPEMGFAGFIRLRLGQEAEQPITDADHRLASSIEAWQGTRYVWGGASRSGTDCSGFVMAVHQECGIDIPHGSANLRTLPGGQVVHDELRYGDVLVYPGHAALYIGNGRTAETVVSRGVWKSTIWSRRSVVVRRFINLPETRFELASRSGNRASVAKRKAAVRKRSRRK